MDVRTFTEEILAEDFILLLQLEHNVSFGGKEERVVSSRLG